MNKRGFSSVEVARLAGVSRTTVSFVLNNTPGKAIPEKTRQRIIEAAQSLNYQPDINARRVAKTTRRTIGLIVGHTGSVYSDAYILRLLEGIAPVLNKHRCQLKLVPLRHNSGVDMTMAASRHLDGVLVTNMGYSGMDTASLANCGVPVVVIGVDPSEKLCQIDIDNLSASQEAVQHLLALGHRRIGMIVHASLEFDAARARLNGYRSALGSAGIAYEPELVQIGDFSEESGRNGMKALLALDAPPTAVFAGNDAIAWGVVQAMEEAGLRIPDDISLVGFDDDIPSRFLDPPLTTITVPAVSLGERAARMLLGLLANKQPETRNVLVPVALTIRDSSREFSSS